MSRSEREWNPIGRNDLGFLNVLSDMLATAERRNPGVFPRLRDADCLFVGSDYGGEHRASRYQTISFLICDIADCAGWNSRRAHVRSQLLPDGRRMAYKNLGDGVRRRALPAFLEIANALPGALITFVTHNAVRSLFSTNARVDVSDLNSTPLEGLAPEVAEKALRIIHLLGLLLAGFSAPGQNVLWATDEDSIAANEPRVRSLVDALARTSSHILPHDLGRLRVATAKQDIGDLWIEDLLAIPDLVAGALPVVIEAMFGNRGAPRAPIHLPPVQDVPGKVRTIVDWFSDGTQRLKRMVVLIDEEAATGHLRATQLDLHGTRDQYGAG